MLKRDFKAPLREACLVDITFQIALGIGQPINQFHYVPPKQLCSLVVCIVESASIYTNLVELGSVQECKIIGIGNIMVQLPSTNLIILHQVQHISDLMLTLISVNIMSKDVYKMTLRESLCVLRNI